MQAIDFKESNITLAENQDQYLTLRAHHSQDPDGIVTTCWKYTWKERLVILFKGKSFLQLMTFGNPVQPVIMVTKNPVEGVKEVEKPKVEIPEELKEIHSKVLKEIETTTITDNVYAEPYLFQDVTNDEFVKYFEAVVNDAELLGVAGTTFPTERAEVDGVVYEMMFGQGSAYFVYKKGNKR